MRKVTASEVKRSMSKAGQEVAVYSRCSGCNSSLVYKSENNTLYIDTGCNCADRSPSYVRRREWQDAADLINLQDEGVFRRRMAKNFYIDIDKEPNENPDTDVPMTIPELAAEKRRLSAAMDDSVDIDLP